MFLLTLFLSFYVFMDIINEIFFVAVFSSHVLFKYRKALDFYTLVLKLEGKHAIFQFFLWCQKHV